MENVIYWIGVVVAILLALYIVLFVLYKLIKPAVSGGIAKNTMPTLKPVSIPTKAQKTPLHKLVVFVFEVRRWELAENWHYKLNDQDELVIPKGFKFDGASIPRPFWALLSPIGLLLIPGLLHDYGYKYNQIWKVGSNGQPEPFQKDVDKGYWDQLFKDVGDDVNGMFLINIISQLAVVFGGDRTWEKHRKVGLQADPPILAEPPMQ